MLRNLKNKKHLPFFSVLSFFALFFFGCAQQAGKVLSESNQLCSTFPHPYAWADPKSHGTCAWESGVDFCLNCHLVTANEPTTPLTCHSCHPYYPHLEGWGNNHADFILNNGVASCATNSCHGAGLVPTSETKGPDCSSCHDGYPHPPDWEEGIKHGITALSNIENCKICHGQELNREITGSQSCEDCHPSYLRHNSAGISSIDWSNDSSDGHGRYVLDQDSSGDLSECMDCHGEDFEGGISNKACRACHLTYPYLHRKADGNPDPEWEIFSDYYNRQDHGFYLLFDTTDPTDTPDNPDGSTNIRRRECSICHGSNLASSGGGSGVSCQSCHIDAVDRPMNSDTFSCKICHLEEHDPPTVNRVTCLACHVGIEIDPEHDEQGQPLCTDCHELANDWKVP